MSFRKFGFITPLPTPVLVIHWEYMKQVSPHPENPFLHLKMDLLFNPKQPGRKKNPNKSETRWSFASQAASREEFGAFRIKGSPAGTAQGAAGADSRLSAGTAPQGPRGRALSRA